jgi:L-fucose isomerase-like protein
LEEKKKYLASVASFGSYPDEKLTTIAKLGVAVDKLIDEYSLNAVAVRCWDEFVTQYHIAPCLILSDLNERGIPAACELDVNNAIMMYALQCASQHPVMLLDLNNNYGEDKTKSIMFHCSAIPGSFFCGGTCISEHLMFKKTYGEGTGVGIVNGKVKSCDVTIGSFKTEDGELWSFSTEGKLTDDAFDKEFFGCGIVYESPKMPDVLRYMFENGYRHHVAITPGSWSEAVEEAFEIYLDYNCDII